MGKTSTTTTNATSKTQKPKNNVSVSSCSSSETEEEDEIEEVYSNHHQDFNTMNKKASLIVHAPSIKSLQASQIKAALRTSAIVDELDKDVLQVVVSPPADDLQKITMNSTVSISSIKSAAAAQHVIVRDFAYPADSPLHFGRNALLPLSNQSALSLSSPDFNGRDARALFDFSPETEYEIGLKAGQSVWVQYRQCPGWLIADVQDETGLIPESYVEFI
ncbi:hypothetical protein [Parasitella parasitica]|uniref:SH3 domain-containing protein n=1 Tax=Parasitella parasitica TaxID=35722 RepID=A0A0B7N6Q5_9FUNG|nr:hypothetical protein [Parasitella parasitica]